MVFRSIVSYNLKTEWNILGVISQKAFYLNYIIEPHNLSKEKVFVIISDALRYECDKEFSDILNTEAKGSATVDVLQGVLHSCTKLGMASLLPNKNITLDKKIMYM